MNDWGLPVAVTPKVKGIVDETAENFVGVVGGMAADGLMCEALEAADLLIGFGLDPVEIDQTWPIERRRSLVSRAVQLYRRRGTVQGLADLVELYAGVRPEIIEGGGSGWSQTPGTTMPGSVHSDRTR